MIVYYRLVQDFRGLMEGSCIKESDYESIYFLHKCLFEHLTERNMNEMVKWEDKKYCQNAGIEFMLFYNERELNLFLDKIQEWAV